MNRYQFTGNLGKDAEVRTLESGVQTIGFAVAITEKWTDRNGEKKENTTWVNCTIWKQAGQSTALATYLKKGQKVLIEGKPTARAYSKPDGTVGSSLEVRVDQCELIGGLPMQQSQHPTSGSSNFQQPSAGDFMNRMPGPSATVAGGVAAEDLNDDLPF